MQRERRPPAFAVRANLNLDPADVADAGAQGFGDGFFGGETGCQPNRIVRAVFAFASGEEALEKALAEALYSPRRCARIRSCLCHSESRATPQLQFPSGRHDSDTTPARTIDSIATQRQASVGEAQPSVR